MNFIVKETKKQLKILKDPNGNFFIKEELFIIPLEILFSSMNLANEYIHNKQNELKNDIFHSDLYIISEKYNFEIVKKDLSSKPVDSHVNPPEIPLPDIEIPLPDIEIPSESPESNEF
jgi:hypothetical protein